MDKPIQYYMIQAKKPDLNLYNWLYQTILMNVQNAIFVYKFLKKQKTTTFLIELIRVDV